MLSAGGAPRESRTRFSALQERRIAGNAYGAQNVEPAERIERSSVAYHATALPLSYTGGRLEPKGGFEPPSELYEGSVFPTKLLRPYSWKHLERVTGFEPVSGPWQGPILAARRYPPGASEGKRTLLASLEGWNSTNKSHSPEVGQGFCPASRALARLFRAEARNAARKGCPTDTITYIQLSKNTLRRQRVDG